MVEICAGLRRREFVAVHLIFSDRLLGDVRGPIHDIRQDQAMPMHRGGFRQAVLHIDAHMVALPEAQARARHLAIEGIGIDSDAGQDRPADDRGFKVVHFDAVLDPRL